MKKAERDSLKAKKERKEFFDFVNRKYDDNKEIGKMYIEDLEAMFKKEKADKEKANSEKEQIGTLAVATGGDKSKVVYKANGTMPEEIAKHYNSFIIREGLNEIFDEMEKAKQSGKELTDEKKKAMHNERIVSKLKKMPEQKTVRYVERSQ